MWPDPHDPRVAHGFGERGVGRNDAALALHASSIELVDALRQVEGWPAEHGRSRGPSRRRRARLARPARPRVPLGLGDEARDGARDARRGGGGDRRPRRAGRARGLDGAAPARARVRAAVRGPTRRSRSPAGGGSTRTPASRCWRERRRRARRRCRSPEYLRAAVLEPLGLRRRAARFARRGDARQPRRPGPRRARAAAPAPRRAGDARRGDVGAVPGPVGVLPDIGRLEPNDWGLGVELRDAQAAALDGLAQLRPRTFGHFGGSGTFLWVDPEAGLALACLTDLEFGRGRSRPGPRSRTPCSPPEVGSGSVQGHSG